MRATRPAHPRARTAVVGGAGLLAGLAGGWLAGLLRVPRPAVAVRRP